MENEENPLLRTLEEQWTCPISRLPISDPVVAADGFTYEREFITDFLKITNNSPLTGQPLNSLNLVPNLNLKRLAEKIKVEMPAIISQDIASKTEIQQLKEEIEDLKEELKHQKIRNDELLEKEEAVIKKKIIEKSRHQDKNLQLKMIRDQKNVFQQDLHELRTKEQQQRRQFELLKQELSSLKVQYQTVSRENKENGKNCTIYRRNRDLFYSKVKSVFAEKLDCIEDIFRSIQATKRHQLQMRAVNNGEVGENGQNQAIKHNRNGLLMDYWETELKSITNKHVNGPYDGFFEQAQNDLLNYKRLQSIRWLMSKMPQQGCHRYISQFYRVDRILFKPFLLKFIIGIRLDVMSSRIPFAEYLNFSWHQIRILDLSACHINDELWQKFVEASDKFVQLRNLNLLRNIISSVKMVHLLRFPELLKLDIRHNNLSEVSKQQLHDYEMLHLYCKVDYSLQEGQDQYGFPEQDNSNESEI